MDRFVECGAKVMACGRGGRPEDLSSGVLWREVDVSDGNEVSGLRGVVEKEFGSLSVLVNNAGMQLEKSVADTTDEEWDALMGVNVRGVFLMCREFIPVMVPGGSIINIGSIAAEVADHGLGIYNASKAFVHGLTRSIAVDHGPAVRCNAISPGWIMTAMADAAFDVADDPVAAKNRCTCKAPGRQIRPTPRCREPRRVARG